MAFAGLFFAVNMILNPGFENLTDDGKAADWKAPSKTYSYVKGEGRDGSTALKFSVKKKDPYTFPTQDVKVEPGKRYRFSAWVARRMWTAKAQAQRYRSAASPLTGNGSAAVLLMVCVEPWMRGRRYRLLWMCPRTP